MNSLNIKLLDCTAETEATILRSNNLFYSVLSIIYILRNKIQF
jgi:hypothetical protein